MLKRPADCWLVLSRTHITYVRARPARAKISTANGPTDGVLYAYMYDRYIYICILYIYIKILLLLFSMNIITCNSSKPSSLLFVYADLLCRSVFLQPSASVHFKMSVQGAHTASANRAPYSSTSSDFYLRLATNDNNYDSMLNVVTVRLSVFKKKDEIIKEV